MRELKVTRRTSTESILKKLNSVYGINKCRNNIEQYAKYLELRKENQIKYGNYNVLITYKDDFTQIKIVIEAILQLLIHNNITDKRVIYIDDRDLKSGKNPELEIANIIIATSENLNLFSERIQREFEEYIELNQDKVFIVLYKQNDDEDIYSSSQIFWKIQIEKITEKDKMNYVKRIFRNNQIKVDNKCNVLNELIQYDYKQMQQELMNMLIKCKSQNITKICNDTFKDLKEKETKELIQTKSAMQEMMKLEGLDNVKKQIQQIVNFVKLSKKRAIPMPSLHMIFGGNSGSGKTSIAKLVGRIFAEEKILSDKKIFVEVNGRDLVAKYVGQTAYKTKSIIEKAIGGVLFIDEAYSLISDSHSFEEEAIATLIKEMEDKRDKICIILAGYTKEMKQLLDMNPGFRSRINFHINFEDYTSQQLLNIFKQMCQKEKYKLTSDTEKILLDLFEQERKKENFGNGRFARNVFEKAKIVQASRVIEKNSRNKDLITTDDINVVISDIDVKEEKRKVGFAI